MIRKLQIKFIIITMLAVIVISGGIFGLVTIENFRTIDMQTDAILNLIAENEGIIPEYTTRDTNSSNYITKETQFSTRYFTIEINSNGEIVNQNMNNIATVTHEDVENILQNIKGKSGYYENFKYRAVKKDENKMIIFLDCTVQLNSLRNTTNRSIIVVASIWCMVLIIVSLISKKILKPIIQNIEKQKQFITNASHELKTPLAVITSDIDVLEMTIGEDNEWLQSIKSQTKRLNTLFRSLLNLANVEEGRNKLEISNFSINSVINEEINDLKPLLQNKKIEINANEEIMINADIDLTKQVIIILLDNAIKYTPDEGIIKINIG